MPQLIAGFYASYILNHLSCEALDGNVPLGMLYGVSPDISIILLYTFYQPVLFATHNQSYPSVSEERAARWVGFGEHVGDALTHKLLVSIRSLRLVIFLAKLNNLEVLGADIGNAYLEAKTKEKLHVVAGPEFEELEGHILVIYKALYGLKSSGLRWSQKIHDIMLDMGFSPCKADPCVWLRKAKCATKYEYVAIYVDDLLIACTCASEFTHTLKRKHNLKIKGDGPLKYHLGCDYHLDPDGTLVALPKRYISKILDSFHQMFPGESLPQVKSPLDKNDHPELDNSELASDDLITKFMCMVGQLQWAVTLGR